jgi:ABC-type transport system involved in multi-copper enzyme maturation permease subunit
MLRRRHLELFARHSVRHGVRGGAGLIAIFATLLVGLVMASMVIAPLEAVDKQIQRHSELDSAQVAQVQDQAREDVMKIARKAMGWAIGASDAQVEYLTAEKPALISAILILLMVVTPLFACLGAFNQTSGDNATRGLRFLLIRTERQNIFLGRFIGTVLFMAAVFALLFAVLGIYIVAKIHVHPPGAMAAWLIGGYFRMLLFSLPYIAMCAWLSGSIDSPFGSLVLSLTIAYVWPLFVGIGSAQNQAFSYLGYITPWSYKWWLFSERPWLVAVGALVMLAFTALLVWFGLSRFKKRDL